MKVGLLNHRVSILLLSLRMSLKPGQREAGSAASIVSIHRMKM
jgi:hypothetical protein